MSVLVPRTLPAEIVSNINQSLRGNRWEFTRALVLAVTIPIIVIAYDRARVVSSRRERFHSPTPPMVTGPGRQAQAQARANRLDGVS
jgi:hypothetical protein